MGRDARPGLIGEPRWDRHKCPRPRKGAFSFVAVICSKCGVRSEVAADEQPLAPSYRFIAGVPFMANSDGESNMPAGTRQATEPARWDGTRGPDSSGNPAGTATNNRLPFI